MANEIHIDHDSVVTIYFIIRNITGNVNIAAGATFEPYTAANIGTYNHTLTENGDGGGHYVGDFNSLLPNSHYFIQVFEQAGASPADGDSLVSNGAIDWDGASEILLTNELAEIRSQTDQLDFIFLNPSNGKSELIATLSSTGLDTISASEPSGRATTFREMIVQLYMRFFNKATLDNNNLKVYTEGGSINTTQSVSDTGTTQTVNKA